MSDSLKNVPSSEFIAKICKGEEGFENSDDYSKRLEKEFSTMYNLVISTDYANDDISWLVSASYDAAMYATVVKSIETNNFDSINSMFNDEDDADLAKRTVVKICADIKEHCHLLTTPQFENLNILARGEVPKTIVQEVAPQPLVQQEVAPQPLVQQETPQKVTSQPQPQNKKQKEREEKRNKKLDKLREEHNKIIKNKGTEFKGLTKYEKEIISIRKEEIIKDRDAKIKRLRDEAKKELKGKRFFEGWDIKKKLRKDIREAKATCKSNIRIKVEFYTNDLKTQRKSILENAQTNTTNNFRPDISSVEEIEKFVELHNQKKAEKENAQKENAQANISKTGKLLGTKIINEAKKQEVGNDKELSGI